MKALKSLRLTYVLLLATAVLTACSADIDSVPVTIYADTKIIGGTLIKESDPDSGQFVAKIVFRDQSSNKMRAFCSGTFIAPRILLTAAHCVPIGTNPVDLSAVRMTDEGSSEQIFKVQSFIRHEGYANTKSGEDDLALLLLEEEVAGVLIADVRNQLPATSNTVKILALGYGRTSNVKGTPSGSRRLKGNVFRVASYEPSLYYFKSILDDNNGVCNGDSGGPALYRKDGQISILGVAASVEDQNGKICNVAAKYMNVAYYRDWIEQGIKILQEKKQ